VLTFDPARHRYFYNGRPVPNVTRILESAGMLDFGGASFEAMQNARELGTLVHETVALDNVGRLDMDSVDEDIVGYLIGWRRFRRETGFVPRLVERRVYHASFRYAGTLDAEGELRACSAALVDIKSGSKQRATGPQTAAYDAALMSEYKANGKRKRFGVYLTPDGRYDLVPYDDREDFAVFMAALSLFNWKGLSP
jgi:hypothetical protein